MSAYTHHGGCSTSDPCKRCFEFGETTERRRIIKLIEPLGCPANGIEHDCENNLTLYTATDLIALIKGEK
jgi:hypothetical protein